MSNDPTCRICNEPKSKHVATAAGPYTHPREATGEGKYVLRSAGSSSSFEHGMEAYQWERWEFVPTNPKVVEAEGPRECTTP